MSNSADADKNRTLSPERLKLRESLERRAAENVRKHEVCGDFGHADDGIFIRHGCHEAMAQQIEWKFGIRRADEPE